MNDKTIMLKMIIKHKDINTIYPFFLNNIRRFNWCMKYITSKKINAITPLLQPVHTLIIKERKIKITQENLFL
jgi:hypothetical protein